MKTKLFPLVLVAAVFVRVAFATDLDAPAVKPVTIRTEMDRGLTALNDLSMDDPTRFHSYVDAIVQINKQKNTDTDGFQFGIYYRAWHDAWLTASIGRRDKLAQRFAEMDANWYYVIATSVRKKLGLTEEQVQEMAGPYYVPGETHFDEIVKSKNFKHTYPTSAPTKPSTEITSEAASKK
jgi:hypothetical protein